MRRYLFPLSPFLALVWAAAAVRAWRRLPSVRLGPIVPLLALALLANFVVRDGLLLPRGRITSYNVCYTKLLR